MSSRPRIPDLSRSASALSSMFLVLLLAAATDARGDIYRWVDEQGVVHFTDDQGSIPDNRRGNTGVFIKEGPRKPEASPPPPPAEGGSSAPSADGTVQPGEVNGERERLNLEISQLKAKIEAKEALVRSVDEKRSLAINPLRNRVVDPADMDLYEKYRNELPEDRLRLQEMENRLR